MVGKTARQKWPGTWAFNQLQMGVALGYVGIGLLLAFGAGFIVGMWYQAAEHITPVTSLTPTGSTVERWTQGQDLTFYSTLNAEPEAKPPDPAFPPPPAPVARGATNPPSTQPVALRPPKPQNRGGHQEHLPPQQTRVSSPSKALAQPSEAEYSVQVGSFRAREDAERLRLRLVQKGHAVWVQPSLVAGQGIWYRVRVGSFPDRAAADRAAQRLATQERLSVMVTAAPEAR
jgi:cell division protein FtsN